MVRYQTKCVCMIAAEPRRRRAADGTAVARKGCERGRIGRRHAGSVKPLCRPATSLEGWLGTATAAANAAFRGRLRDDDKAVDVDTLKVRDAADVEQVVRSALASEQPLEIIGHGTKRLIGQPMATNALLDLSALNAVTAYEPNELIITVQAGAPLADVLSLIDSRNQQFAFEPVNTARLLGTRGHRHHRRHDRRRTGRAAPHQGRRRARSSARRACGVRFRRQLQGRRQGGEERHRLRPLQAAGGVVGHARGHDGGDVEGDAAARERTHAGCCAGWTTSPPTGR